MSPTPDHPNRQPDRSPKEQRGISPTLFYTILVVVILAIAAFLVMRPGGKGTTNDTASPSSHH